MEFDAVQRRISEIILAGEHVVPRYQRPYAWDEDNIRDLWEDLKKAPADGHFMGNMVVYPSGTERWDIVDGQQRLTTILIALRAIKDEYDRIGSIGRAKGIENYLQRIDLNGDRAFRLQYRTETGFLHLNLFSDSAETIRGARAGSSSELGQLSAYQIFGGYVKDELESIEQDSREIALDFIRDRFLRTTVVYIRVDDRKNAFSIFETLNDRGKSLNQVDLVKNLIMSTIPASSAREEEILWVDILKKIEGSDWAKIKAEDFLGYFWSSTGNQNDDEIIVNHRVRRSVDEWIRSQPDATGAARQFIEKFHKTAEIFSHFDLCLASPNGKHWKDAVPATKWRKDRFEALDAALYGCLVPSSNVPLPLIFSLLRRYIHSTDRALSLERLTQFLRAVENLQFRWSVSQRPSTSTIRRAYRRAAFAVDAASNANEIQDALDNFRVAANALMPTDAQFREGLKRLTYFTQRPQDVHRVRHVLERIESHWGDSHLPRDQDMTIEHIEPQGGRSINTRQNFWVGKIGNLTLLPGAVNSELPAAFPDKSRILAAWVNPSDMILLHHIGDLSWDNSSSNERMEQLLDVAVQVWPREM